MITLLFAFLFVEETNEIFETLSPMENQQIERLSEGERRYLLSCIKNGTFSTESRSGWPFLHKGDMLLGGDEIKVDQIIDESNFIGFGQSVWVEGVNTSNLRDDAVLNTKGMLFLCDGNKRYTTVLGGSRTVMKLIRIRSEGVLEPLKAIAERRGYHV